MASLPTIKPPPEFADMSKKNAQELEEILTREKKLLQNRAFVQKLPDKGAKLKEKVSKLEKEVLKKRTAEKKTLELTEKKREIESMEWKLQEDAIGFNVIRPSRQEIDSDDDDPEEDMTDDQRILKLIATSQITQNQPKVVIDESDDTKSLNNLFKTLSIMDFPDASRIIELSKRHNQTPRPLYNRPVSNKNKGSDIPEPIDSMREANSMSDPSELSEPLSQQSSGLKLTKSTSSNLITEIPSASRPKTGHWDDSLLPSSSVYKSVKVLTLEESFDLTVSQSDKLKEQDKERQKRLTNIGWSNDYSAQLVPTTILDI